jgi:hypothetical protein
MAASMQDVGALYGLPPLPPFEYRLFESQFAPPASRRLAFAIKEVFGQEQDRCRPRRGPAREGRPRACAGAKDVGRLR